VSPIVNRSLRPGIRVQHILFFRSGALTLLRRLAGDGSEAITLRGPFVELLGIPGCEVGELILLRRTGESSEIIGFRMDFDEFLLGVVS
jgi:hypothetical protein